MRRGLEAERARGKPSLPWEGRYDFAAARRLNAALSRVGSLASDGRPILKLDAKDLLSMVLEASPFGMLVPALAFLHVGHQTRGLLLGATIAVIVGIVDDFRGLPWYGKLAGQVAAAAVATGFGIWVKKSTFSA